MNRRERKKLEALILEAHETVVRLRCEGRHEEADTEQLYYYELRLRQLTPDKSLLPEVLLGLAVLTTLVAIGYLLWGLP